MSDTSGSKKSKTNGKVGTLFEGFAINYILKELGLKLPSEQSDSLIDSNNESSFIQWSAGMNYSLMAQIISFLEIICQQLRKNKERDVSLKYQLGLKKGDSCHQNNLKENNKKSLLFISEKNQYDKLLIELRKLKLEKDKYENTQQNKKNSQYYEDQIIILENELETKTTLLNQIMISLRPLDFPQSDINKNEINDEEINNIKSLINTNKLEKYQLRLIHKQINSCLANKWKALSFGKFIRSSSKVIKIYQGETDIEQEQFGSLVNGDVDFSFSAINPKDLFSSIEKNLDNIVTNVKEYKTKLSNKVNLIFECKHQGFPIKTIKEEQILFQTYQIGKLSFYFETLSFFYKLNPNIFSAIHSNFKAFNLDLNQIEENKNNFIYFYITNSNHDNFIKFAQNDQEEITFQKRMNQFNKS